ncbi:hypothetical protein MG293_018692, partial [Ovis ammon polii]
MIATCSDQVLLCLKQAIISRRRIWLQITEVFHSSCRFVSRLWTAVSSSTAASGESDTHQ